MIPLAWVFYGLNVFFVGRHHDKAAGRTDILKNLYPPCPLMH
jgi:hypothetical protein